MSLADKRILEIILKYAVSKFTDIEIYEIMVCIEDGIETDTKFLVAVLSNLGKISRTNTKYNVP